MALSNSDSLDPLVVRIHDLREGLEVRWFWVKGHVCITDNEAADRLAKQGAALPDDSDPVQLSPRFVKSTVHREILKI